MRTHHSKNTVTPADEGIAAAKREAAGLSLLKGVFGFVNPGEELKNGATLISWEGHTVLAVWKDREYVTWVVDTVGNCYSGHYFADFFEAVEDFKARIQAEQA